MKQALGMFLLTVNGLLRFVYSRTSSPNDEIKPRSMSDTVDQKPVEQKTRSESYPPAKKLTESETAQSKAFYSSENLNFFKRDRY